MSVLGRRLAGQRLCLAGTEGRRGGMRKQRRPEAWGRWCGRVARESAVPAREVGPRRCWRRGPACVSRGQAPCSGDRLL